jgi:hypothetical protein
MLAEHYEPLERVRQERYEPTHSALRSVVREVGALSRLRAAGARIGGGWDC